MFKNLILFRIVPEWTPNSDAADTAAEAAQFTPCGATQATSAGWVPPRGEANGPLVELVAGQWLLKLQTETKILPAQVVAAKVDELADQIEHQTGRKPGRRQRKELKEQAAMELLPQAFAKRSSCLVWIDPKARLAMIEAGSMKRAEEVVTALVKTIPGFGLQALGTTISPAGAMALWLVSGEPPAHFSIDRECELKSPDELKAMVRYTRHNLDMDEVREHIKAGKVPTKLAMTWMGRVSFVLTDTMSIKRIGFDDVVFESNGQKEVPDEHFDADAAIATGELSQLIPDLLEAMGGELGANSNLYVPRKL